MLNKKSLAGLLGLMFISGSLFAAVITNPWILQSQNGIPGQLGQDGNGNVTVTGQAFNTNCPIGPNAYTVAQLTVLAPLATGQLVIVSNPATFNDGFLGICISTGTGTGAWVQVSSATAVTSCK